MRRVCLATLLVTVLALLGAPFPVYAQFLGHNLPGDAGLLAASQPDPGIYIAPLYYGYRGDTIRDRNGDPIAVDPERQGSLDVNGYGVGFLHVTSKTLFGGQYAYMIAPAWTDNKFEIPILGVQDKVDVGFTDLYVQPLNLGWHKPRWDFNAGIGFYAPTGSYDIEADDNLGLGMWSLELFGGGTYYFDEAKSWHFSTLAAYEFHSEKDGTDIEVGDILTLEGGIGKSFMEGAGSVGLAYYAQWKVTDDDFGGDLDLLPGLIGKNRGFGIGPEFTLPLATKETLFGFLNVRYLWEFNVQNSVEGNVLIVTLSFPWGGIALQ